MINIEELKLAKWGINSFEYIYLYKKVKDSTLEIPEIPEIIMSLIDKGYLDNLCEVTTKTLAIFPAKRNYTDLAIALRDMFPKGKKAGRHPWRCTAMSLATRLKSIEKAGLENYSNEEILAASRSYVNGFNDFTRDNEMMLCMYFVTKDKNSTLLSLLESQDDVAPSIGRGSFTTKI